MKKRTKKIEKPGKNHAAARVVNDILRAKKGGKMADKRKEPNDAFFH
jgi:hypothetical protein